MTQAELADRIGVTRQDVYSSSPAIPGGTLTRRVDFVLFMVDALTNDDLIHEAPAIVGCQAPSAQAHAGREPNA